MKEILLIGIAVTAISLGGCTTAKDKAPEPAGQLQQTTPNPERQAQIKEIIRQLKENIESKPFWLAIDMIVRLDAKEAIPELINLLDDEDKCLTATRVLETLGAKEAIPKITKLLNHKQGEMRLSAACALANLGAKEAIPELMKLLNDEDDEVRIVAACVLDALGVKGIAIPELMKLLNDESISVRLSAACALANLGAKEAIPELMKLLKTTGERIPSSLYISAARALGRLNARESIPELIKLLAGDRWEVRQAAGDALSELDDIETIPELTNQPIDYDYLWACKRALAINPKDASVYYYMGKIYDERFDNPSKAIFCYQKYLELAPPDAPDRKRVERWIEGCNKRIHRSRNNSGGDSGDATIRGTPYRIIG